jgi:hypothetical protein
MYRWELNCAISGGSSRSVALSSTLVRFSHKHTRIASKRRREFSNTPRRIYPMCRAQASLYSTTFAEWVECSVLERLRRSKVRRRRWIQPGSIFTYGISIGAVTNCITKPFLFSSLAVIHAGTGVPKQLPFTDHTKQ